VVSGDIVAEITIVSPAGGTVTIDNTAQLTASVAPSALLASQAVVVVQERNVSAEAQSIDLTKVDDDVRNRVQRATVFVALDNPFAVGGELELRLHVPGVIDLRRPAPLAPGATTARIELTLDEARSLLGRNVGMSLSGTVSQTAGPVTIRPTDEVTISPRINLILEFGS
jgi:hypothetical protein